MSRFRAAIETRLRSISSVTIAGSVIDLSGRAPDRRPARALVWERGEEVAAFEDGGPTDLRAQRAERLP